MSNCMQFLLQHTGEKGGVSSPISSSPFSHSFVSSEVIYGCLHDRLSHSCGVFFVVWACRPHPRAVGNTWQDEVHLRCAVTAAGHRVAPIVQGTLAG